MVGREILVARRDLVLDEPHDVGEREGAPTRAAGQRVGHARRRRAAAFGRAVRIRLRDAYSWHLDSHLDLVTYF